MTIEAAQKQRLEAAIQEHGALVARIASTYEVRPALAEELVQDVFAAMWKALPTFRGESSLKTFVARIAHNICVSHVRRAVREKSQELHDEMPDGADGPEIDADRALKRSKLLAAVRGLPLSLRQVVTLHLEGFTDKEIGEALAISSGNVAVRLTRARAALKKTIGGVE